MVDIHTHILPGVDDGARNSEEALCMAAAAWETGTECLVLTPHCNIPAAPRANYRSRGLIEAFERFRGAVRQAGIPIRLTLGAEVFADERLPELLKSHSLLTLAGSRYLLIEFDFGADPGTIRDALAAVSAAGLRPVLAHPERYAMTAVHPDAIFDWVQSGCVIQLNKGSLLGRFGNDIRDTARLLLEHRLVHCIASDAHHRDIRTPELDEVRRLTERLCGPRYTELLFDENPLRIVSDQPMRIPRALPF